MLNKFLFTSKQILRQVFRSARYHVKSRYLPHQKDTFCILAFNHLHITPNGTAKMCCIAGEHISKTGSDLSLYNVTYDEIWNSQYMVNARRAMSKGRRVSACERCYHEESTVGTSRRLQMNEHWLSQNNQSTQEVMITARNHGWKVKARPVFLQFNMGNLCNLACRMCASEYSSRINDDPVHGKWMPAPPAVEYMPIRADQHNGWWIQKELMFGEILSEPKECRRIIFQGGEPLIIKGFVEILDYLIKEGAENNVVIELTTNMTKVTNEVIEKLERFKCIDLGCSIDGIGDVLEYIRYPAKWDKIQANIKKFSGMKNINYSFNVAIQAYNLMTITDLYRYCDENKISVSAHFLAGPVYLHVLVLPKSARKIAIERLLNYIDRVPFSANTVSAQHLVHFLGQHADQHYVEQIRPFMLFTNDMDVSRNQNFAKTYPELVALFSEEGYPWINETRYTPV